MLLSSSVTTAVHLSLKTRHQTIESVRRICHLLDISWNINLSILIILNSAYILKIENITGKDSGCVSPTLKNVGNYNLLFFVQTRSWDRTL